MQKTFFLIGSLLGGLGVILGAFGAHAFKARLSPEMMTIFETGSHYHLIHALAVLATAWAVERFPGSVTTAAGWLFIAGILIFSGTLYILSLTGLRWLGAITPLGGLCLILAWLLLAWAAWRA